MNELDAFFHGLVHWTVPLQHQPFPARSVRGMVWRIGVEVRAMHFCAPGGLVDMASLRDESMDMITDLWRRLPKRNRRNLLDQRDAVRLTAFELDYWNTLARIIDTERLQ